jgi:hypothetical protein
MQSVGIHDVLKEVYRRPLSVALVEFFVRSASEPFECLSQRDLCFTRRRIVGLYLSSAKPQAFVTAQRDPSEIPIDPVARKYSENPLIVGSEVF